MFQQLFNLAAITLLFLAGSASGQSRPPGVDADEARSWIAGFRDSISHWQEKRDLFDYDRYDPAQVREIADNILLYQRSNGGWPANEDMTRVLSEQEKRDIAGQKDHKDTTFDNCTTYTQTRYLGHAYEHLGEEAYREAANRGLAFILQAQYENGGWPHSYPNRDNYYPRITFADDVMVGVLDTIREAALGRSPFTHLDDRQRQRCRDAYNRGQTLLLDLQVKMNGRLTGWAGQYHEATLKPCPARPFEPAAVTSAESVQVLRYLMSLPEPDQRVKNAIVAGIQWLEDSKIENKRLARVDAPRVRYDYHTSTYDLRLATDPHSPPLWARFYDLETNQPVFADRDGQRVASFADLSRERRTGYSWYGNYAAKLLAEDFPAWQHHHPN